MAERLGPSLHTHEGRGPFKDEMCYEVVDNASGTTHVMRRGELHVVGQGGDNARLSEAQRQAEQFADTSVRGGVVVRWVGGWWRGAGGGPGHRVLGARGAGSRSRRLPRAHRPPHPAGPRGGRGPRDGARDGAQAAPPQVK